MKALILAALAAFLALPALAEVEIKEVTSPAGITAWLVEDHSIPFTALELRFRGGTSLDAPGKRGSVYLMTALLEEGAADLDSRAYARALESLAASFDFDADDDSVAISARFLTENRDQAAALLRDTLHAPRFDPDAIERVRAQVVSGLLSDAKDPND
ncbi:MAG: insulinase family protein, partial [Sedimentitalea sp.]|nr:insulinase family protein [Sedimentitalea sp.]